MNENRFNDACLHRTGGEIQRIIARYEVMTKEELAYAHLWRAGEEMQRKQAIYAAMNEAQLNDARLHRSGKEGCWRLAIDVEITE